jgi:hypothetical protein
MLRPLYVLMMVLLWTSAHAQVIPLEEEARPHFERNFPIFFPSGFHRPHLISLDYQNYRLNSDHSGQRQLEQQACINPVNPENMVAVWTDVRLGATRIGIGRTFDGGQTWADDLIGQLQYPSQGDPVLTVDDNGVFTARLINFTYDGTTFTDHGLWQASSHDGGITWTDTVWARITTDESGFDDKEVLTVDTSSNSPYYGSFYCTWAYFPRQPDSTLGESQILFIHKRPEDEGYSEPVFLSQTAGNQWVNIVLGPNGEIYTSWIGYDHDGIMFARSTDGGMTFTPETLIRGTQFQYGYITPSLLIFTHAPLAVDHSDGPFRGRLYAVFTDADLQMQQTDIFLMYSDDHGETWSTPVMLNDDDEPYNVHQYHPWISVDEQGFIWVSYYDRRHDPANYLMDMYFTVSMDGGATWRPNERITEVSSDPAAGTLDAGLIGEYNGWYAHGGKAVAVWTDTRLGDQDTYAAVIDNVVPPPSPELVIQSIGSDVHLGWNAVPGTEQYRIFYSRTIEEPYDFIGITSDTAFVHLNVINADNNNFYYIRSESLP